MRDDAARMAKQSGMAFYCDSGPTDVLLAKVGLVQVAEPKAVDPSASEADMKIMELLDARGLRIPAMFSQ